MPDLSMLEHGRDMTGRINVVIVIAILFVSFAHAQPPKHEVLQFPSADPFAIRPGSSFSASQSASAKERKRGTGAMLPASVASDVEQALSVIEENYVDRRIDIDGSLTKSAINSMLKTLDPHSTYFDQAEYRELIGEERSEYFGTGTTIVSYEKDGFLQTFVLASYPGSAAEKAAAEYQ